MELKNILSKLTSSGKEKIETFLAIEISNETIKSACWAVKEGGTEILKMGSIEEWEEKTNSLIAAVDSSVTIALEGIKPEPTGVIFGLPETWVEKDQIIAAKKAVLKKICEELEFKPLGFVVTTEALIDYLKILEGTPVSAIFVNLEETQSTVALVNLGKIIGSEIVGRSEDLAADVREGLARFKNIESYPSRMILFDGMVDFEEAKQQIISFDWLEALPFLHFPKVESLEANFPVKAVAISGGREVAKSLGFEIMERKEKKVDEVEKVDKKVEEPKKEEKVTTGDFGFVEEADIVEVEKKEKVEKESSFAKASEDKEEVEKVEKKIKVKEGEKETEIIEEATKEEKEPKRSFLKELKGKILSIPFLIVSKVKNLLWHLPSFSFQGKPAFLLGLAAFLLISLFVGGFLAYWNLLKAEVTIFVSPKILEKSLTLTISSSVTSTNEEKGIIPGEEREVTIEGKKTIETTGKTLVGEKAKGEVIVLNKTDVSKVFPADTVLIGPDNKKFVLDEEVKVASKSSQTTTDGEQITYGKATVEVTASSIGTEFNLAGGTTFKFKDYSESLFTAKTEAGLSGGTSREVRAVSQEDRDNLLTSLTDESKSKAREKLEAELETTKKVLEKGMKEEVISQQFDKKVDEEADKLSLELKVKLTTLIFSESDINTLLLNSIRDSIPSGFTLEEKGLKTEIEEGTIKEGEGKIKVVIKASLIPKFDTAEIKKNLVGRYPQVVEQYLASLPNFLRAEIKISPNLPSRLRTLPRKEDNIQLEVKVEE